MEFSSVLALVAAYYRRLLCNITRKWAIGTVQASPPLLVDASVRPSFERLQIVSGTNSFFLSVCAPCFWVWTDDVVDVDLLGSGWFHNICAPSLTLAGQRKRKLVKTEAHQKKLKWFMLESGFIYFGFTPFNHLSCAIYLALATRRPGFQERLCFFSLNGPKSAAQLEPGCPVSHVSTRELGLVWLVSNKQVSK